MAIETTSVYVPYKVQQQVAKSKHSAWVPEHILWLLLIKDRQFQLRTDIDKTAPRTTA